MRDFLKAATITVCLVVGGGQSVLAQDYDKASAAYQSGDYATALDEWRTLAEQGNADAQNALGTMYNTGKGVPQDYAEAVKWYRLAAEQGDASAERFLGLMYQEGHGVPQDYAEAVKWYRLAAEQGDAYAQGNLGIMYGEGLGVIQDNLYAHMWFNIAASLGNSTAGTNRETVAEIMTATDISAAQRLARECVANNYKGC